MAGRGGKAGWLALGILLLTLAFLQAVNASCNNNYICDPGEYGDDECFDCGTMRCGDNICQDTPGYKETCSSCSQDCKKCINSACTATSQCTSGLSCCAPPPSSTDQTNFCLASCTADFGWGESCQSEDIPNGALQPENWEYWFDCIGGCQVPTCKFNCQAHNTPPVLRNDCQDWVCDSDRGWYLQDKLRGSTCFGQLTSQGRCETNASRTYSNIAPECQYKCDPLLGICSATSITNANYNAYYCGDENTFCYMCALGYQPVGNQCLRSCTASTNQFCVTTTNDATMQQATGYCSNNKQCVACKNGFTFNSATNACDPVACTTDGCTEGALRCTGSNLERCNKKTPTCNKWETNIRCGDAGFYCSVVNNVAQCTTCGPTNGGIETCDNLDNNCNGQVDELVPGLCPTNQVCTSGTCTTTCTPSTEVCDGRDNDCDTISDEGNLCPSGVCLGTSGCVTYEIAIRNGTSTISNTLNIMLGDTAHLSATVSPANPPAYITVDGATLVQGATKQVTGSKDASNNLVSTTYRFDAVRSDGSVVATRSVTVNTVCSPGMACYCQASCINTNDPKRAPQSGYCPSGTVCGTCASGYFHNGACVECTAATQCVHPEKNPSCYTASCVNNACVFQDTAGTCGNNQYCSAGKCVGCIIGGNTCTSSTAIVPENSSAGPCKIRTETFEVTTPSTCITEGSNNVCKPLTATTRKSLSNVTSNSPNGEECGLGLACLEGKCINALCVDTTIGFSRVNWAGNHSICNSNVNLTDCEYRNPVPSDMECANTNLKDGYCTAEDTCTLKCSTIPNIPGCSASLVNFAQVIPDRACPGGQLCYQCSPDYNYDGKGNCVASSYTLDFTTTPLVAKTNVIITPALYNKDKKTYETSPTKFTYYATMSDTKSFIGTYTVLLNEPGEYPVTITAVETTSGRVAATISKTLTITCPAGEPCCPQNSNTYLPDGAACSMGGSSGVCSSRVCIVGCIERGNEVCDNNKDDDCNGKIDCEDATCAASCGGLTCSRGEVVCDRACTNIHTNNLNCGECGNRCDSNEQCQQGVCIEVPNCDIICNTDEECGRGMICVNPGSCDASYCAPATVVETNESAIKSIMERYTKTYKIVHEIEGDELRISIINLAPVPLRNFTMNVNIPKEVAPTASSLGASEPFTVIQEDPVIAFNFASIKARQEVTIDLPIKTDAAYAKSVQITGSHNPLSDTPTPLTQEVTITSNLIKDGNKSKLLLGLSPHAELYGVRVPVEIPKCIATSAKQLQLSGNYDIIQDDPLVVWTFDELTSKETIEISIDGDVTENCKNSLTAFAVADLIDKPVNPWVPLLLIPIIGIILVTFSRFHSGGAQERLSKKEFFALAKEQGRSDQDIEESWKEYERKF